MPVLIHTDELAAALEAGRSVRLLDVRWRLNSPEGRPAYVAGHLPGAVYVDLERELSRPGHPEAGRYPLPALAELQAAARRWGLDAGDTVVAYDDNDGVAAARAWWLLRRRGVDIRVLDGGIRGWVSAGHPVQRGDVLPPPGNISLRDVDPGAASIDDAARAPRLGTLVDVRAPAHYRGLGGNEAAAGHIPGAVNIPTVAHMHADGTLRPRDEIRATITAAGVDPSSPIVLYCNTGIASAHSALAFAVAGLDTQIFVGSWSQWSQSRSRPVAVGPSPLGPTDEW